MPLAPLMIAAATDDSTDALRLCSGRSDDFLSLPMKVSPGLLLLLLLLTAATSTEAGAGAFASGVIIALDWLGPRTNNLY
jgi:hypothetical protein